MTRSEPPPAGLLSPGVGSEDVPEARPHQRFKTTEIPTPGTA